MDKFVSMSELLRNIPARENYDVYADGSRRSKIKIFAPHGGCIEPCTEAIALGIGMGMYDSFVFSGKRKSGCFETLHVTSTHYDEPRCLQMAREADLAIAIHGCDGGEEAMYIGGGNREAKTHAHDFFSARGYRAEMASGNLTGEADDNFINLARRRGVQFELTVGFRRKLFPGFPRSLQRDAREFSKFIGDMQMWIQQAERSLGA